MNRAEFLKQVTFQISKRINRGRYIIVKKILEKILETVSKVLIVPPIVFTGIMVVGILILLGMSIFTINFFKNFVYMMDTRLVLGTIGIVISLVFMGLSIIGWPVYILVLIGGIWFIRSYRKFIKNYYLYKSANDFIDRV
ncbi:Uncharacterised protein [[Clostridium] sordellii]|uniref:hypothetical protein n=1 Tax=Paraclostridium sordellii TaxID=1505 RepID=UPI0005E45243|nr:hypothetical protein [Paeniclostridium sordellii]MDU7966965.1 hypothetical protein [Paeniclostridium sordellii]CEQ22877.1 Uncharacterised protein [[Clostridium] sordellii] [Paeniclostridium sordellii]